jgi:hypothetical protein
MAILDAIIFDKHMNISRIYLEEPGGLPSLNRINLEEPGGLPSPTRIKVEEP